MTENKPTEPQDYLEPKLILDQDGPQPEFKTLQPLTPAEAASDEWDWGWDDDMREFIKELDGPHSELEPF
ncbi:hypothetical protein [Microbacterium sp. KR10-403]|uniref:hypothetical protein n=1 Tax=Microbacterium sp. KR10-403 TaxID=3158581 RepID=UPI0032E38072